MDKNRIGRPPRCDELAQHSEVGRFSRGGRCGGRAGTQRVLTWGDPVRATGGESAEAIVMSGKPGAGRPPQRRRSPEVLMHMKGRTEQERSDHVEDIATDDVGRRGSGEGRHEGKHGSVQEQTMMERVLAPENLRAAWRRVKANAGAPGIDGMTVEAFPASYGSVLASRFGNRPTRS
jgi:hypothetical protein